MLAHTLCVYRCRGRRPDAPGNAAKRHACCGSNKHIRRRRQKSTRSVLPRQGQTFHAMESSRKGTVLFFSLLRKERGVAEGPRPSRLPENGSKLYRIVFSCCFRLSSLNQHVVRPAFSDVLNRCERVIAVQTQDRYFSKMGSHTTSLQGRMYSKRAAARYLCCGGNLILRYAD